MQHDDTAYLLDMLVAARDAVSYVSELTQQQFEQSRLHQDAVFKTLEVIGEAAGRVTDQTRSRHPEMPWVQIIGMRNRLVHAYFDVDLRKVWDTAQNDIPRLIALLESLVPPEKP
ncbi:MAG TPA: DUF86 domain-containing protein [Candidatus Hydrogenedentes bacterium]|nr:DUF86 domain-containing protein [Candidatus Hydrogenedentota bacterium]HIJ72971.1 DUF86 domain-containing protein [Candidatus Hydrogenedentota bacterium]